STDIDISHFPNQGTLTPTFPFQLYRPGKGFGDRCRADLWTTGRIGPICEESINTAVGGLWIEDPSAETGGILESGQAIRVQGVPSANFHSTWPPFVSAWEDCPLAIAPRRQWSNWFGAAMTPARSTSAMVSG